MKGGSKFNLRKTGHAIKKEKWLRMCKMF